VILAQVDNLAKDPVLTPANAPDAPAVGRSPAEDCARIKDLGYVASKRITMYGERLKVVSDPVQEGDCIVVQVISEDDAAIRRLRLPVSTLLGLSDRGGQKTKFGKRRP